MTLSTFAELAAEIYAMASIRIKVGVLKSGDADEEVGDGGFTMVQLAAVHELGLGGLPKRSFIRQALVEEVKQLQDFQVNLVRQIYGGKLKARQAADLLGEFVVALIRRWVREHPLDPGWANALSTIKKKGSDRPLVDTGRLLAAITYEVAT